MSEPIRILFVCTGNTCRSPMAEALWRALGGGASESAGVSAWSGLPAAPYALQAVKPYNACLSEHKARDLTEVEGSFTWVLTMTRSQCERVVALRPEWKDHTLRLSEMVGETGDIADPAGQGLEAYQAVADTIHRYLQKLKDKLYECD